MKKSGKSKRIQVVRTVAWRLISELMRRHLDKFGLRVLEMNGPGGEEGLGIFQESGAFPGSPLCRIMLSGEMTILVGGKSKVVPKIENYVDEYLDAPDPSLMVGNIESKLNLPGFKGKFLPSTSPPVLMFRLISGLLERFMMSREDLSPSCGWVERAGGGSHACEELMLFPDISAALGKEIAAGGNKAAAASKYWLLFLRETADGPRKLEMLFDLDGGIHFPGRPESFRNALKTYEVKGRNILPMINELEDYLRNR